MASSVIVEAPHVERIGAFEAEYDPILIVDAHGVEPSQLGAERVQSVARRHLVAHIGCDRALGYGLKYPTFFKDTHLQRVNS